MVQVSYVIIPLKSQPLSYLTWIVTDLSVFEFKTDTGLIDGFADSFINIKLIYRIMYIVLNQR